MRSIWINKNYIAKIASTVTGGIYAFLGFIGMLVPLDEILSDKMSIWVAKSVLRWVINAADNARKFNHPFRMEIAAGKNKTAESTEKRAPKSPPSMVCRIYQLFLSPLLFLSW